jgi:hypothetical protein
LPLLFLISHFLLYVSKIRSKTEINNKIVAIFGADITISCCLSTGIDIARKANISVSPMEIRYNMVSFIVGIPDETKLVFCIFLHPLFSYFFNFYCVFRWWNSECPTVNADDFIQIWICDMCP